MSKKNSESTNRTATQTDRKTTTPPRELVHFIERVKNVSRPESPRESLETRKHYYSYILGNPQIFPTVRKETSDWKEVEFEFLTFERTDKIKWDKRAQIDALIIDLRNSNALIKGLQLCRTIRNNPKINSVPIFFIGNFREREKIAIFESGADDCIANNSDLKLLPYKLRMAVRRYRELRNRFERSREELFERGSIIGGRYEILQEIGRGGMGVIFKVRHARLDFELALKALRISKIQRQKALRRFEREIRALAQIRHPHLVRIYDSDTDGEIPYYVMDYLPKGSLYSRLKREGRFTPIRALDFTAKVAEGLHQAHLRGILHRDIKSENILFDLEDQPVLIDFGLSILKEELREDKRLTRAGCVVGTPHYLSPEQMISPYNIDARSDIFSLGIVLMEMLIGFHPLGFYNKTEVMIKLATEDLPSPRKFNPEIPSLAEEVCLRATARDREERYQSAKEFAEACRRAIRKLNRIPTLPFGINSSGRGKPFSSS